MKPVPLGSKERAESKLPFFDLDSIKRWDGCSVMIMTNRARRLMMGCLDSVFYPTCWLPNEDEQGIDIVIGELMSGLTPIDCSLDSGQFTQVLIKLDEILQKLNEGEDMAVVNNYISGGGCGCGCSGSGQSYVNASSGLPTVAPPETDTAIELEKKCKTATLFVDDFEDKLRRMSGFSLVAAGSLAAFITLCVTVIQPQIGIFLTLEGITLLWALVASIAETGNAIAQFASEFTGRKQEVLCRMYALPSMSASAIKTSFLAWVREQYIDGSPTFLMFYAMGLMYRYSLLYDSERLATVIGRCDDCMGIVEEFPTGYNLIAALVDYQSVNEYPDGSFEQSEPDINQINYSVNLQPNGNFFFPFYVLRPATVAGASNVVGLYIDCVEATRSASPIEKTSIREIELMRGEPTNGQLETGKGYLCLMTDGNPSLVSDVSPYFVSRGVTIVEQPSYGTDNDVVLADDYFNGRDKLNAGGTSGRLSVKLRFHWLVMEV